MIMQKAISAGLCKTVGNLHCFSSFFHSVFESYFDRRDDAMTMMVSASFVQNFGCGVVPGLMLRS